MKNIILILIVFICSCKAKKVLPGESPLFPEQNKNKFWLINSVATQENGHQFHVCALTTLENNTGKLMMNYYTSFLDVHDSSFVFGNSFSESPFINEKPEFPFFMKITNGDSLSAEQSVFVERTKLRLATELKDEGMKKGEAIKFRMKFKSRNLIRFRPLDSQYGIMTAGPIKSRLGMTGGIKKNSNNVFITTFSKPDQLLNLEKETSLVWINMILDDEKESYSVLFKIREDRSLELLAYPVTSARYPLIKVISSPAESSVSGKAYHLHFSLQIPGKEELEVRPRIFDQELNNKKSSFWMGGVEVVDSKTKVRKGVGNMYNFSNKTDD